LVVILVSRRGISTYTMAFSKTGIGSPMFVRFAMGIDRHYGLYIRAGVLSWHTRKPREFVFTS
jgi:hypothetical protein